MKDNKFKPILAPNEEPDLSTLKYPLLASYKLDGIRCIFYKGEILSRSLKPIQNKQLKQDFESIRKYTEENKIILDGEIYSPELTFQDITSYVMTEDFLDAKTIKKQGRIVSIPDHLKFYCFDLIGSDNYDLDFRKRTQCVEMIEHNFRKTFKIVEQWPVNNPNEINLLFDSALSKGCEGLILRDPNGRYKCGRGTLKEGIIYKVKPFVTFDAQITDVVQSTEVREGTEKKINELGRSVTSKKKDDRVLIEKASAFWVLYEGKPLKVTLAMSDPEKEEVWHKRDKYIGRFIEYKAMKIGMKELPRHPVFLRFRDDRN